MRINKKHIKNLTLGVLMLIFCFYSIKIDAQLPSERPHTRWWWMDNAVDSISIVKQLNAFSDASFGGVEIVPIYGVKENKHPSISFLSQEWISMVALAIKEGRKRGIEVYLAAGAGWPLGGSNVGLSDAASFLKIRTITPSKQHIFDLGNINELYSDSSHLLAVVAYRKTEKKIVNDLKRDNDRYLIDGYYDSVVIAIEKKTFQKVKRSSIGGAGYTLDHFSAAAVKTYLQSFYSHIQPFADNLGAVYNDSYEVYGADWTISFFSEFQKRKHYDLRLFLPYLISSTDIDSVKRIKNDYRDVLSQMMTENFAQQFTTFAHDNGTKSLNQAHGSPANLLDLYAKTDIAEGETFGSSRFEIPGLRRDSTSVLNVDPDPNMLRFAASAAHTQNHPLVSCEQFTWLTEHFKTSFSLCKPEVEQVFLAGVNSVVYHGSNYSPVYAAWPGWLFYASVDFTPTNSLWPVMKSFNDYVTNCQKLLQGGLPFNDVAVYWPVYDLWNTPQGLDMPLRVHNIDEWLHPTAFNKTITTLESNGYSFDFISDLILRKSRVVNKSLSTDSTKQILYKSLIVPACENMPLKTFQKMLELATSGLTIIFEKMPVSVPGFSDWQIENEKIKWLIRKLKFQNQNGNAIATIGSGKLMLMHTNLVDALKMQKLEGEPLINKGLKFIKRKYSDGTLYYIVNHTANDIDDNIDLLSTGNNIFFYDPISETSGKGKLISSNNHSTTRLQLKSGQSIFIKIGNFSTDTFSNWKYIENVNKPIALDSKWKLHFESGGPILPKDTVLNSIQLWTNLGDSSMNNFSGSASYTTSFNFNKKVDFDYVLHIKELYEAVEVYVNGKKAGSIWSLPQELSIGKYLVDGNNEICIKVYNLMANRIRYMDRTKMPWKVFKDINIVDIKYKPFDASNWDVAPSGIAGISILPVSITK